MQQYVWDDPHLFKIGVDQLLRRCVSNNEAKSILWHCHSSPYGGHFNGERIAAKVLQIWILLTHPIQRRTQICATLQ